MPRIRRGEREAEEGGRVKSVRRREIVIERKEVRLRKGCKKEECSKRPVNTRTGEGVLEEGGVVVAVEQGDHIGRDGLAGHQHVG